jgi:hypothetical protein
VRDGSNSYSLSPINLSTLVINGSISQTISSQLFEAFYGRQNLAKRHEIGATGAKFKT